MKDLHRRRTGALGPHSQGPVVPGEHRCLCGPSFPSSGWAGRWCLRVDCHRERVWGSFRQVAFLIPGWNPPLFPLLCRRNRLELGDPGPGLAGDDRVEGRGPWLRAITARPLLLLFPESSWEMARSSCGPGLAAPVSSHTVVTREGFWGSRPCGSLGCTPVRHTAPQTRTVTLPRHFLHSSLCLWPGS